MPYVNVKVLEKITPEQKEKVIAGVTEVLRKELGKPPEATYVVIDEVPADNWGKGGQSMTRKREVSQ